MLLIGLIGRLGTVEERIFDLEYSIESSKSKSLENKDRKNTHPRLFKDYRTAVNDIIGMQEGEERQKETEELFETIMTKNFPELMSDTKPLTQKAQRTPVGINAYLN